MTLEDNRIRRYFKASKMLAFLFPKNNSLTLKDINQTFLLMNTKNFLASGVSGGIVNYLLGWVFYGMLFTEIYPNEGNQSMLFIALGCLAYGLFMAFVFTGVGNITDTKDGLKNGAIFGFFYGLTMNLFMYSSQDPNFQNMGLDLLISIVMGAITGMVVAMVNSKMD